MKVRDAMSSEVVTVSLTDGLYTAWEKMHQHGIRHLPVLDENGRVCGILSDRDVRRPGFVDNPGVGHAFAIDDRVPVSDAMSEGLITVEADDDLLVAVDRVLERGIGALPVFTGEELVGMVSAVDLLRALRARVDH